MQQNQFPDKEIGLQYAVWDLKKFRLIVSAEELPYLQEELKDKPLERLNEENVQYILAYGVFKSGLMSKYLTLVHSFVL
ncbi:MULTISPECIES: hypothetical protein [Lactococcus]|uniref:hypothetical protein n=1 Tax=Lactococcus TaxID=1357 RepID=UPI0032420C69